MTGTNTQDNTTVAYGGVILARDFSSSTTDVLRDTWTVGKMFHLVEALNGALVAIEVDNGTGFTVVNAVLKEVRSRSHSHGDVLVETTLPSGAKQATWHWLPKIGVVVALGGAGKNAKWIAIETQRNHVSAAIDIAKELHGEAEGRGWGVWDGYPLNAYQVNVTYTPDTGNAYYADKHGKAGIWKIDVTAAV